MSSYIFDNLKDLQSKHYIRKAGGRDYWFDFTFNRLEQYRKKTVGNFCLVLYASTDYNDSYVFPFNNMKEILTNELLDDRGRWSGYIRHNMMRIVKYPNSKVVSVSEYYNNFNLLIDHYSQIDDSETIPKIMEDVEEYFNIKNLKKMIYKFNKKYREVIPSKRLIISEQIARPGAISDYLKKLKNYKCEICGKKGFIQKNGVPYIEAHHIIELHKLIPGSYCSDNIIVVCPTCHRKLHFAQVTYSAIDDSVITIIINDISYKYSRTILSD